MRRLSLLLLLLLPQFVFGNDFPAANQASDPQAAGIAVTGEKRPAVDAPNSPPAADPAPADPLQALANRLVNTTWRLPDGKEFTLLPGGKSKSSWTPNKGNWKVLAENTIELHVWNKAGRPEKALVNADATIIRWLTQDTTAQRIKANADESAAIASAYRPVQKPVEPKVADLIKSYRDSLVFVTGPTGSGSGFIANFGGVNYLVTNAHVAAEARGAKFKALDGAPIQEGASTVAVDHDIFRIQLPGGGVPFEIMNEVEKNVSIGDSVAVLGNAEGAGVVNATSGKIVGVGPNLVEVDAPFVPGNSGSPIIHLKTGKVIGVATYALIRRITVFSNFEAPIIRRFGYRLDSIKTWQPVNWTEFFAEAARAKEVDGLTEAFRRFLYDLSTNHRLTPAMSTNPVIQGQIDRWLSQRSRHLSASDAASNDENLVASLKAACSYDIRNARSQFKYDYFLHHLTEEENAREQIKKALDQMKQAIPAPH